MLTESSGADDLAWRAAGHAALSDVGRLRVIDSLEVADVSPRNLAATLGMSSNLLAHHLKVLESAGLVRRLPSESGSARQRPSRRGRALRRRSDQAGAIRPARSR